MTESTHGNWDGIRVRYLSDLQDRDHNVLENRDAPHAHPASAIDGFLTPSAYHTVSGDTFVDNVGEDVAFGNVLYLKSDGKWWKADADASTTMPAAVMATATILADTSGNLLLRGFAKDDTWNWTVGGFSGLLYVSTTPGNPTQTAPSGSGDQVQILGFAKTADVIFFNPSYNIVEIV